MSYNTGGIALLGHQPCNGFVLSKPRRRVSKTHIQARGIRGYTNVEVPVSARERLRKKDERSMLWIAR